METMQAIRRRRTLKVLADPQEPFAASDERLAACLPALLDAMSWAPFHYPSHLGQREGELESIVPWRSYVLNSTACRSFNDWSFEHELAKGKLPNMLAAAVGCVVVTWLPDLEGTDEESGNQAFQSFAPTQRNMEHLAAASAATQNLLLAATDLGFETYWSSGGMIRSEAAYEKLGIPKTQVLLAAAFLFDEDLRDAASKTGAFRESRGPQASWSREVSL